VRDCECGRRRHGSGYRRDTDAFAGGGVPHGTRAGGRVGWDARGDDGRCRGDEGDAFAGGDGVADYYGAEMRRG
jgi:hypothetical protein